MTHSMPLMPALPTELNSAPKKGGFLNLSHNLNECVPVNVIAIEKQFNTVSINTLINDYLTH